MTEALKQVQTPAYVVDQGLLTKNLEILKSVQDRTGCHILLAQKAFSMFYFYPLIGRYLKGTTASSLYEAKLGKEEMGGETHIFSPAYLEREFDEVLSLCDHIVFNSFTQWKKYKEKALQSGKSCGLRINPECSTQDHAIYDPCSPGSRLGIPVSAFEGENLDGIEGLHFHTLCEQNADALQKTLEAVEQKFGRFLYRMKWLNFGGGHHITRADYDIGTLVSCILHMKEKYDLEIYLEPGEAVALNAGFLVTRVEDIVRNGMDIAILDTSAACHMPDVIEMPYRPPLLDSGMPGEKAYTYRLGGPTCRAGDIIGDYSFDQPLQIGDKLVFGDMAIYSMVKNNTFNGVKLPDIAVKDETGVHVVKHFEYENFKGRLS